MADTQKEEPTEATENTMSADKEPTLSEADQRYIDKMKDDMRKAAKAREASEARGLELEHQLDRQAVLHQVALKAEQVGCINTNTLLILAEKQPDFTVELKGDELDAWFKNLQSTHAYLFPKPKPTESHRAIKPTAGPMLVAGRRRVAASTQQLAAGAYRTA